MKDVRDDSSVPPAPDQLDKGDWAYKNMEQEEWLNLVLQTLH